MAKLSYRQLEKKRIAGWMLFYIEDPEDAECIFQNNLSDKDKTLIRLAYDAAKKLMEEYKTNPKLAINRWTAFYKKEFKTALQGQKKHNQNVLTLF